MSQTPRDYGKLYKELMRNAGSRMKQLNRRALQREQAFREAARQRYSWRDPQVPGDRGIFTRLLRHEIDRLVAKLASTECVDERIYLKSEIAQFRERLEALSGGRKRRPPESGLSVPAVPPRGPIPKQGGAAASLEFGD